MNSYPNSNPSLSALLAPLSASLARLVLPAVFFLAGFFLAGFFLATTNLCEAQPIVHHERPEISDPMCNEPGAVGDPGGGVCPEATLPVDQMERFLTALNNGLIDQGVSAAPRIPTPRVVWSSLDASALLYAITTYYGERGGFVSRDRIYPVSQVATVEQFEGPAFYYRVGDEGPYYYTHERGISECAPIPPDELSTEPLTRGEQISASVQCLFALAVRDAFFLSGQEVLSSDLIDVAGADSAINNYLAALQGEGLIASFEVTFDERRVDFLVAESVSPRALALTADLVNPYRSVEDERLAIEDYVNYRTQEGFLFTSQEALTPPELIESELLKIALERVIALGNEATAFEKRRTFRETFGYHGNETIGEGATPPTNCTYPNISASYAIGTNTPVTTDFVDYSGPEIDDFSDNGAIKNQLSRIGYTRHRVDGRSLSTAQMSALCPFRLASVIFLNAHGARGSTNFLCDNSIKYNTTACCQYMKSAATFLGLAGAATITCSGPLPAVQDPTKTLWTADTGTVNCQRYMIGEDNRCMVMMDLANLFAPGSGFQDVAALFTSQCDGGQCTRAAFNPARVMDLYTGSNVTHYNKIVNCDASRYARDLSGQAQYCRDPNGVGDARQEPFDGSECSGTDTLTPAPPYLLRSVEGALSYRGVTTPGAGQKQYCWSAPIEYNSSGFEEFRISQIGGRTSTKTEFYPSVASLNLSTSKLLRLQLTSEVSHHLDPEEILSLNFPPFFSDRPNSRATPYFDKEVLRYPFSQNVSLASEALWASPPAMLAAKYGKDQSDWPWYVTVRLEEESAPNGIEFVGNAGAAGKWIWPDDTLGSRVAPFEKFNGRAADGGDVFEAHIPALPVSACCKPRIEFDPHGEPVQNGCSCYNDLFGEECGTDLCCYPDAPCVEGVPTDVCVLSAGTPRHFSGTVTPWAQCCGTSGSTCEPATVWQPDVVPQCPEGDGEVIRRTAEQFIEMPFNEHEPRACPERVERLNCGGPGGAGGDAGPGVSQSSSSSSSSGWVYPTPTPGVAP